MTLTAAAFGAVTGLAYRHRLSLRAWALTTLAGGAPVGLNLTIRGGTVEMSGSNGVIHGCTFYEAPRVGAMTFGPLYY